MTYKIGQKVETEIGNGIIVAISGYEEPLYIVGITNIGAWGFNEHRLKPYKTAHEKLIEMGYEYEYNECNDELSDKVHTYYNPKRFIKIEVTVTPNGVGWYTHFYDPYNYIANLEILEIIKQLVEEMAE